MTEEEFQNSFLENPIGGFNPPVVKKKRNLPGNPDPEAEVIALSPKTLMATNRFLCEICGKGFQRDQNLQLHRRGHNLPWKLKQRSTKEIKKRVYVCPEKACLHHHPSRALGDLTGIKKHFCRKHGEKKWKCEKCSKRYAVQSDCKAHTKTCGTKEYKCNCGTLFSRRDSFITHRAFCDALAEETARVSAACNNVAMDTLNYPFMGITLQEPSMAQHFSSIFKPISSNGETTIDKKQGLSLWMAQGSHHHDQISSNLQEIHQLGSVSSGSTYAEPIVLCSNIPPPSDSELNWVFGNKSSSINVHEELTSTSLPMTNVKETGTDQLASVPSLFSTQQQHSHITSAANMSATALLQKAAQIGATTTDPSFLGCFGLKCNSNQVQDANTYCGLFGSSTITNNIGSDVESSANDISTLNQMQLYPCKRRQIRRDDNSGGHTRDFLGVGVQATINQWMDLI
ncbi:hypothetical protein CFOL_v3_19428 [Cephalotus follicularis]|uniref:C2H2-type domain-containing protein n=1 Tax=Cephalotus follicularis TaxID=3775 RepID=A0A1Q3C784_CEPFO|nr:hypothetical protein CFOL_v3_19428 [Cephalotus follicularis]